ncbi:MerR family transcriptional regulator [Pseudomonas defluvii]|uniref:MerR family transcriptional regulator n=1 Tax=Pseudomonas defluvii TaxID=1876757 RepID=UPI003905A138
MPSEPLPLPIREVARLTGVNPVTLRAWERRYGLITPQRTGKGHRLYSTEHVQRIQQIVQWLNRGVSVGQIKALLDSRPVPSQTDQHGAWQAMRQDITGSIAALAERRLDQQFNQAIALYPATTLCEQLLLPLFAELELRWQGQFGARMEQVFFHCWLRSKLGARLYHSNRQINGPAVLLVNGSDLVFDPRLWLCAWLLSSAGYAVEVFDWPLPPAELALTLERMQPQALLLCLNKAVDMRQLERSLSAIQIPTLLNGSAISIHQDDLLALVVKNPRLCLLDTPLEVVQALQDASR